MANEKKKTTSAKSLETAREANYFAKKMFKNAYIAQQEGRPIGWSMVTWYEGELIAKAMGIELIFPENYGAFCAALGLAQPHLDRCEQEGFPSSLCGYARNCIGYAAMMAENDGQPPPEAPIGGMPKPALLIGSASVCDGRIKWFQALKRYINVPQWTLERPQAGPKESNLPKQKEKSIRFMTSHLKDFVAFLEKLVGRKMDWNKLEELVEQTLKTLRLAHEVDLLRRAVPSPMVAQDFWSIMIPHLYLPYDPEAYTFYQKVYDEVKYRVDNKIGAVPNEKYRMLFAELPPWHSLGFFDKLAEKFGIAVVYESWGYHAPLPIPDEQLEGVTDPLERIARLVYGKFHEVNETATRYHGDSYSYSIIGTFLGGARDYRADGYLCHPLMSCRPATYSLFAIKHTLEEQVRVPGVVIDGDIVDLRVFNEQDALAKMEAFTETMDHYREERRKAGLDW
jgi:benzoyl-CoA reductase subunit B